MERKPRRASSSTVASPMPEFTPVVSTVRTGPPSAASPRGAPPEEVVDAEEDGGLRPGGEHAAVGRPQVHLPVAEAVHRDVGVEIQEHPLRVHRLADADRASRLVPAPATPQAEAQAIRTMSAKKAEVAGVISGLERTSSARRAHMAMCPRPPPPCGRGSASRCSLTSWWPTVAAGAIPPASAAAQPDPRLRVLRRCDPGHHLTGTIEAAGSRLGRAADRGEDERPFHGAAHVHLAHRTTGGHHVDVDPNPGVEVGGRHQLGGAQKRGPSGHRLAGGERHRQRRALVEAAVGAAEMGHHDERQRSESSGWGSRPRGSCASLGRRRVAGTGAHGGRSPRSTRTRTGPGSCDP